MYKCSIVIEKQEEEDNKMSFEEFKSIKIDDETPLVTFDEFKNCITNNPVWYKTERRGWSLYKLIDVRGSVDKHFE